MLICRLHTTFLDVKRLSQFAAIEITLTIKCYNNRHHDILF
jgi:hypothetical protein